jgi:hypothetical protein
MSMMFYEAISFEGRGIENFDVSQVSRFDRAFSGASGFDGDVTGWRPNKATTMASMFEDAVSFSHDISSWQVPSDLMFLSKMFYHTPSFTHTICWANLSPRVQAEKMFCASGGMLDSSCSTPSLVDWAHSCSEEENAEPNAGTSPTSSAGGSGPAAMPEVESPAEETDPIASEEKPALEQDAETTGEDEAATEQDESSNSQEVTVQDQDEEMQVIRAVDEEEESLAVIRTHRLGVASTALLAVLVSII